ncbi:DNA-binding transcriptional regulator, GntR family [Actinokineospora alba]|uniref:DNA-binding transcriptional regulator, GntR family n=1 Tax=Actinokineospora alba TaxID=504798 RepID=A0A1H0T8J9_9PSEU|nr:GntR family transcriptional regulator [Actinokineospora alba]TDP66337.1 DNA-binding GntR family transcriptional regulator [Actinokineospora alba]SDJ22261.1 DNA-binding transcriptional regulator, GntR family [Actinokineospora alba]SDP49816.1 DNA-binding transcriptional regulator, GntR family [Actinokineospora alba]
MASVDIVGRLTELVRERRQGRSSAADVAASALRDLIMEGALPPGSRVTEEAFMAPLEVSRNTLREAFRLLTHEKLLVHKLNRGVFVRSLVRADVRDLYRVRKVVECAALAQATEAGVERMTAAVERGERAAAEGRWVDVGTANIRFHQAIVSLVGSPRLDEMMRQVGAELRLGFHEMGDPRSFHEGYLRRNREILDRVKGGEPERAEELLRRYLDDAESEMFDAFLTRDRKLTN